MNYLEGIPTEDCLSGPAASVALINELEDAISELASLGKTSDFKEYVIPMSYPEDEGQLGTVTHHTALRHLLNEPAPNDRLQQIAQVTFTEGLAPDEPFVEVIVNADGEHAVPWVSPKALSSLATAVGAAQQGLFLANEVADLSSDARIRAIYGSYTAPLLTNVVETEDSHVVLEDGSAIRLPIFEPAMPIDGYTAFDIITQHIATEGAPTIRRKYHDTPDGALLFVSTAEVIEPPSADENEVQARLRDMQHEKRVAAFAANNVFSLVFKTMLDDSVTLEAYINGVPCSSGQPVPTERSLLAMLEQLEYERVLYISKITRGL